MITSSIHLRAMTTADFPAVAAIESQVQTHPWTEQNFRDSYLGFHTMMVSEIAQKVVGFQVLMFGPDEAELLLIGVHPTYQQQGIGRQLLTAAEELAQQKQREAMLLEVRVSNTVAQHFYQRLGYEQVGRRKAYYPTLGGVREDALLFRKALAVPLEDH